MDYVEASELQQQQIQTKKTATTVATRTSSSTTPLCLGFSRRSKKQKAKRCDRQQPTTSYPI
jgi:hypothetical protein